MLRCYFGFDELIEIVSEGFSWVRYFSTSFSECTFLLVGCREFASLAVGFSADLISGYNCDLSVMFSRKGVIAPSPEVVSIGRYFPDQ